MAERKRNFDDETLRKHLEEQRQKTRQNDNKSPSLVSLVESDGNTIFKPVTFISIIGTIIFAIVTSVTQIINFNNTFSEMEQTLVQNSEQVIKIQGEILSIKNDVRDQLLNTADSSIENINQIVDRLVDLERRVDEELRFTAERITQNNNVLIVDVVEIKDELKSIRDRIRNQSDSLRTLETQIRVLEIRYERITENS